MLASLEIPDLRYLLHDSLDDGRGPSMTDLSAFLGRPIVLEAPFNRFRDEGDCSNLVDLPWTSEATMSSTSIGQRRHIPSCWAWCARTIVSNQLQEFCDLMTVDSGVVDEDK